LHPYGTGNRILEKAGARHAEVAGVEWVANGLELCWRLGLSTSIFSVLLKDALGVRAKTAADFGGGRRFFGLFFPGRRVRGCRRGSSNDKWRPILEAKLWRHAGKSAPLSTRNAAKPGTDPFSAKL
jgi:hypothetical protein